MEELLVYFGILRDCCHRLLRLSVPKANKGPFGESAFSMCSARSVQTRPVKLPRVQNNFRDVAGNGHACGQTRRVDADQINQRRFRSVQTDGEIGLFVWRSAFGPDTGICPSKILVPNLRKKLLRGFE